MFDFIKDKKFIVTALTIAIPVALQNIINTGINFLDTLMVATLDATAVGAVGACNNVFFLWNTFSFGIISGGMILASQFFGAGKEPSIRKTYGLTLTVDFIASMLFFLPCLFFTPFVMRILTNSPEMITEGVKYLKIVCFIYPLQAITLTTLLILRSFGKVRITVITSLVTMFTNIFFNYCLINGHLGWPALGVRGAAIATVISRSVEMIILVHYLFFTKSILVQNIKEVFSFFEKSFLVLFFKTSSITALDELVYGLGLTMFGIAYGRLGAIQFSAVSIALIYYDLVMTFFIGFGSACSVILGMELGKNNIDTAKLYAKYFIKLFIFLAIILSIITWIGKGAFESLYTNLGQEVLYYIDKCMIDIIVLIFIGNLSYLFLVGILRSGGDVKITVFIDLISCWLVGVPLAFLSVLVWKLPVHICFALINMEEVVKTLLGYIRYKQDKWANNLVQNVN